MIMTAEYALGIETYPDYVDLTDPKKPTLKPRPTLTLTGALKQGVVRPRELAVLSDLPPCTVRFTGPLSGTQPHLTRGDLQIGFALPGSYMIEIEAFPYLPATIPLKVSLL